MLNMAPFHITVPDADNCFLRLALLSTPHPRVHMDPIQLQVRVITTSLT
jgi:hypothetical protein